MAHQCASNLLFIRIIIVARRLFGIAVDLHPTEPPDMVLSRPQYECRINGLQPLFCFIDESVFLCHFQVEKERQKDGLPLDDRYVFPFLSSSFVRTASNGNCGFCHPFMMYYTFTVVSNQDEKVQMIFKSFYIASSNIGQRK